MYAYSEITNNIIRCAIEVHNILGPGLLESAYKTALIFELERLKYTIQIEKEIYIPYKEIILKKAYRADIIVDNKVLLEIKSIQQIEKVHEAQVLTYLKFTRLQIGLLLNFNTPLLKNGIKRFIQRK